MSQQSPESTSAYDRFATEVRRYNVGITEVSPSGVTAAIEEAIEQPAVGTALPWEGVELPDSVAIEPTAADLDAATTGVTAAELAVAEYGSILLRTDEAGSEPVSLFNDLHVAVLREEDIVPDMTAAFEHIGARAREDRSSAILATGPSATADMGALVQGAHGPKAVELIIIS
ncbi:LUD domain-containing protein [Halovenus sp. HT40]|uniref:LUD domain-containing protein n=1 Tax=Halovenus sp. HT40 TaxID=3126691 RepID=UPI00300F1428